MLVGAVVAGVSALAGVFAVVVIDREMVPRGYGERPDEHIEIVPAGRQPPRGFAVPPLPGAGALSRDLAPPVLDLPAGELPTGELPPWQRHAVAVAPADGRPMVAIVIDDVGLSRGRAGRTAALPGPLTLALLSYAEDLPALARTARAAGHELLVHIPMEPEGGAVDPGPRPLLSSHSASELRQRLAQELGRFSGYVGVNNHMGSRLTADPAAMAVVMAELQARGLLFLDSRTTAATVAATVARAAGVPTLERDVFLDNELDPAAIRAALATVEERARTQGYAIAIGHPHDVTLEVLAQWLPQARRRGFHLVPLSFLVGREPRRG